MLVVKQNYDDNLIRVGKKNARKLIEIFQNLDIEIYDPLSSSSSSFKGENIKDITFDILYEEMKTKTYSNIYPILIHSTLNTLLKNVKIEVNEFKKRRPSVSVYYIFEGRLKCYFQYIPPNIWSKGRFHITRPYSHRWIEFIIFLYKKNIKEIVFCR